MAMSQNPSGVCPRETTDHIEIVPSSAWRFQEGWIERWGYILKTKLDITPSAGVKDFIDDKHNLGLGSTGKNSTEVRSIFRAMDRC